MVPNSRCVAEQIKREKLENVATGGMKMKEFGKVGKKQNLKSNVMDGVKSEKLEKLENRRIPKLTRKEKIRSKKNFASQS